MNFKQRLSSVRAFVFDVDGVLSSSMIPLYPSGEPMRTANIKDGYAIQLAIKKGYHVAIITGADTEAIKVRYSKLGMKDIYMKAVDKPICLNDFLTKHNLKPDEVMYMGDDIPDYEVMQIVGIAVCPIDAVAEIKELACYISPIKGGEGCGRDVIEQTMKVQGKWMDGREAFGW